VQIVDINVDTFGGIPAHESEAFGGEAISAGGVGACFPFHAGEVDPSMSGYGVETTSERYATRSGCALRVVIGLIDVCMVVEVLDANVNTENGQMFMSWIDTSCIFMMS
jgi:hypothetical protein